MHFLTVTFMCIQMGSLFEGKTASQLQLKDATVLTNGQPFLLRLCNRDAIAALGRFQNRMVYANTRFDNTELYSASIRIDDPYLGMSDKQLVSYTADICTTQFVPNASYDTVQLASRIVQ
jgi:hypothetical protein